MPNNPLQVWKRAPILDNSLRKNQNTLDHFIAFMDTVLKSGAAEIAPKGIHGECWHLPLFGVYHSENQIK